MLITGHHEEVLLAPPQLDATTRVEFRRAALEHLERVVKRGGPQVVIDLQHTTSVDASGLGILVLLQKRARERMVATRLRRAPASLKQMIGLTKLEYLFDIED